MAEPRLKIAVFIDFDNIEIGVKTTLGGRFDPGAVLEAIKERGEVVTKIAYGDWTRAGDHSRELTQHGIQMVQRSLTPGGDKNGADINLALDALEMAFTHNHINAFVIVGGDSDFMALVEKLKQYDRKVIVVGGRQFTSTILQRNCHEFIAYENVTRDRRSAARRGPAKNPAEAMTLVKRALKILADREVTPQLGVLKTTLLQLDPTFSEREYGVSSFRDFAQRLASAGYVTLRGTDRSLHVELSEGASGDADAAGELPEPSEAGAAASGAARETTSSPRPSTGSPSPGSARPEDRGVASLRPDEATSGDNGSPAGSQADGFTILRETFLRPGLVQRWPLYVRQVKQILRSTHDRFDERRYGFAGIVDALRYGQREGLFRLDRDRQGVIRVYPGALFQQSPMPAAVTGAVTDAVTGDQALSEEQTEHADTDRDASRERAAGPEPQRLFSDREEAGPLTADAEPKPFALSEDATPESADDDEATKTPTSRRTRTRKPASGRPARLGSSPASGRRASASSGRAASPSSGTRKTPAARKRVRKATRADGEDV
ncbi:MAG: NYN domain-containing protein [Luteitalea sp.]|nr:NYN domain-containing protein [Luteitalea sp.]